MPSATAVAPVRYKDAKLVQKREPITPSWVGRVPQLKPAQYPDGMPIHKPEYICCKLILRPNKFHSRESFFDFGKVFKEPAKEHGVKYTTVGFIEQPVKIREVLFVDTDDFRLYNNAFILRRRIPYKDGFPIGEPEIVFKFRHPDLQMCAETDVRPNILGDHRVKFKVQALPLKEKLGGIRLLYSHNVQFPRSAIGISRIGQESALDMDSAVQIFPVLARVRKQAGEKIKLVSDTIIEEVLQDIGLLDFGDGLTCKANVAIWRTRGEHRPLIGEFAYQFRFQDRDKLSKDALRRTEAFFIGLQYAAEDYINLGATKTATVYRLMGNPPKAHE
jgi:hypothetical protein